MNDYPRMLYRPGNGPSEVWGELVDTKIVNSLKEEQAEIKVGWLREPEVACNKAKRRRTVKAGFDWITGHWQFWITTVLAVLGLIVAILALK